MTNETPFASIEEAIERFRQGEIVIIVDDEDRENEGDLAIAAEKVTPAAINFMAKHGRGLICLALTEERCRELDLPLMVEDNTSHLRHRLHRLHRGARQGDDRHLRRRPRRHHPAPPSIRRPGRRTCSARGTSSPCAPARGACSSGPGRPRPRSTSPLSPA